MLSIVKETEVLRKLEIEVVGGIYCGTHICQSCETKDLSDALVFCSAEGLKNNGVCIWDASEPLSVKEAPS